MDTAALDKKLSLISEEEDQKLSQLLSQFSQQSDTLKQTHDF